MDAAVSKFYWSFYTVKTPRYKNGMEAVFIPGERVSPEKCHFSLIKNFSVVARFFRLVFQFITAHRE